MASSASPHTPLPASTTERRRRGPSHAPEIPMISRSGLAPIGIHRALQPLPPPVTLVTVATLLVRARRRQHTSAASAVSVGNRSCTTTKPARRSGARAGGQGPGDGTGSLPTTKARSGPLPASRSRACRFTWHQPHLPRRRANSSSPAGRRTSPGCPATRRTPLASNAVALTGIVEQDHQLGLAL